MISRRTNNFPLMLYFKNISYFGWNIFAAKLVFNTSKLADFMIDWFSMHIMAHELLNDQKGCFGSRKEDKI